MVEGVRTSGSSRPLDNDSSAAVINPSIPTGVMKSCTFGVSRKGVMSVCCKVGFAELRAIDSMSFKAFSEERQHTHLWCIHQVLYIQFPER